ncbi:MAG: hypothetical protein GY737_11355 [Desulfobacteraceae bacterium]|nr:hypothetical protein [Desulfobacteraceae bacterium]
MPKYDQLRGHLPSLYRPETGDTGLVSEFLKAVGRILDDIGLNLNGVMQAHWYDYADSARYDAHANLLRRQQELGPLNPGDPEDLETIEEFPYLYDLARLGALISLPPWREPAPLKETVEQYRERLGLMVRLYRNGLGTVKALRTMVEAELPPIPDVPRIQRKRSFSIEEYAPLVTVRKPFAVRGAPFDGAGQPLNLVGPLMRWRFENDGLEAAPLTLYIEGISAIPGQRDATVDPVLELFDKGGGYPLSGIAYQGVIPPGEVLRLRPAYHSWLGLENAVLTSRSDPPGPVGANPTAPGPWVSSGGAPTGAVTAMVQTRDRMLWVAIRDNGAGELWRYNGKTWTRQLDSLALGVVHCLFEQGRDLLIGTDSSLLRMPLYPGEEVPFDATPVAALAGQAVYDMLQDKDGTLWLATTNGALWLNPDDSVTFSDLTGTQIRALHQDQNGVLYFGGELGVFQFQTGTEHWYWYRGEEESDQIPDWNRFTPGELPQASQVYLPPVTSLHAGPDASIWIGTEHGFARYRARSERGLTYKTLLEAYPDLAGGEVYSIREDARGLVWLCTLRGLFRYDGRDMSQYQAGSGRWVSQGRADCVYPTDDGSPRGFWRFNRNLDPPDWQYFDGNTRQWTLYTETPRSEAEDPVRAVLWTDSVAGELGTWDGEVFITAAPVAMDDLAMRVKPTGERIVVGGLPAVPRIPVGESTWRYLSLESGDMPVSVSRPWWTREGRLLPPPDQQAPYPGRYGENDPDPKPPEQTFDNTVFAYNPAAKVWLEWAGRRTFTAIVRLMKISGDEVIHPAILDRVWHGMERVRPAGVKLKLAVEEQIVRGE